MPYLTLGGAGCRDAHLCAQESLNAFIKESLNALEAAHAAKEHAARQEQYERIRRRHKVRGGGDDDDDAIGGSDEGEPADDLRARLAEMTEERRVPERDDPR